MCAKTARTAALLGVLLVTKLAHASPDPSVIALGLTAPHMSSHFRQSFGDPQQRRRAPKPRHLVTFAEQQGALVAEQLGQREGGWKRAGLTAETAIDRALPDILKGAIAGRLDLRIVFNLTGMKLGGRGGACQVNHRFPTPKSPGATAYWTRKGFDCDSWTVWELSLVRHPAILPRVSFFIEDAAGQLTKLDPGQVARLGITPNRVPMLD